MSLTIQNVKDSLAGMLHGTDLDKVTNLNECFRRAAGNVLMRIDPADTIRVSQLTNMVHDDIYDYSCPSDLKGDKVVDLRPQINREESENPVQVYTKEFDLRKINQNFKIKYNSGVKSLRFSAEVDPSPLAVHNMNSLTDNGTWSAGGDASNITRDTLNYVSGNASINFDVDSGGSAAYIENSDFTAIDLEDEDEKGKFFVWLYIPDTSIVSSVELRWGSSASAYWTDSETSPHDQSSFKTGWNLLAFDWNGATETGTVDPSAINYLRLTINYDGTADTDFRVDKIVCSAGEIFEIAYYSECLFRTSGGTWQTTTSSNDDIVNLDIDGENIFILESFLEIAEQLQGADAIADANKAEKKLFGNPNSPTEEGRMGFYNKYKKNHPSEAIKKRGIYYRI